MPNDPEDESDQWLVYEDGLLAQKCVEAEILLIELGKKEFHYSIKFMFPITNNATKYETLLTCHKLVKKIRMEKLTMFVDS